MNKITLFAPAVVFAFAALVSANQNTATKANGNAATAEEKKQEEVMKDFDTLGGNRSLYERAQKLNPDRNIEVVQNRAVDRRWRNELAVEYSGVTGGDAYLNTNNFGGMYQLHITPRWSVGARGWYSTNSLRDEGRAIVNYAEQVVNEKGEVLELVPDIDYPKYGYYGMLNFYPIYGKINMLDMAVAQYDMYLLAGAGVIELKSGQKPLYTGGAGLGLWWNRYFSSRLEGRYETYQAKRFNGERQMQNWLIGLSMGVLL